MKSHLLALAVVIYLFQDVLTLLLCFLTYYDVIKGDEFTVYVIMGNTIAMITIIVAQSSISIM